MHTALIVYSLVYTKERYCGEVLTEDIVYGRQLRTSPREILDTFIARLALMVNIDFYFSNIFVLFHNVFTWGLVFDCNKVLSESYHHHFQSRERMDVGMAASRQQKHRFLRQCSPVLADKAFRLWEKECQSDTYRCFWSAVQRRITWGKGNNVHNPELLKRIADYNQIK